MAENPPRAAGAPKPIDLEAVGKLVAALEYDLGRVKGGGASIQALRDEVELLRNTLGTAENHVVPERLHHMRGLLGDATDAVEADAIKAASYITQIGRLLGLS